jgi:hypothetical protein
MGKFKEKPRYNVISMRVSDEEKLALEEMSIRGQTNINNLMREALAVYTSIISSVPAIENVSQKQVTYVTNRFNNQC